MAYLPHIRRAGDTVESGRGSVKLGVSLTDECGRIFRFANAPLFPIQYASSILTMTINNSAAPSATETGHIETDHGRDLQTEEERIKINTMSSVVKIERVEGVRGKHNYYLRLEYTILKVGQESPRKVLRKAITLVDGNLVSDEDPLFIKIEGDPVRTVENYIDRLKE